MGLFNLFGNSKNVDIIERAKITLNEVLREFSSFENRENFIIVVDDNYDSGLNDENLKTIVMSSIITLLKEDGLTSKDLEDESITRMVAEVSIIVCNKLIEDMNNWDGS